MTVHRVRFLPDDKVIEVPTGTDILKAADTAEIKIKSTCGGDGSCGRCAVQITEGNVEIRDKGNISRKHQVAGYVLACKTTVNSPITVTIPEESRVEESQQVLIEDEDLVVVEAGNKKVNGYDFSPLFKTVTIELEEPTLTENSSDLHRLIAEFKRKIGYDNVRVNLTVLKDLNSVLRDGNWQVSVSYIDFGDRAEIIDIFQRVDNDFIGLAIDIGTTTVVVNAISLETGETIASAGSYNKQTRYGDDVITRIVYASDTEGGLEALQKSVIDTVNQLITEIKEKKYLDDRSIIGATVAGNTVMTHLFLGANPKNIRLEPYIPMFSDVPPFKAKDLGLVINPEGYVYNFPSVASYVGGDIVSGALAVNLHKSEEIILFIDIGTNGEMILGNREWMVCCACSAGPAFEGGGITHGVRAMTGAIEKVEIDPQTFEVELTTIGSKKPIGICGSGLIDCLAKLREVGIIDRAGKFQSDTSSNRLRKTEDDVEFVLAWRKDSGLDSDIVITESDIKNVIRSKGAIYSGIRTMLKMMELDETILSKIIIAGGFGNYLNIQDAIKIGLLPDLPIEKYEFIGNSSVKGAKVGLLSLNAWREAEEIIGKSMTYLELSVGNVFMDEFVSALFLPHTDLSQFPSVVN
ncbi:uncharacterized 2Fe-2S/4Fe-4S cluster protein (DUF4445 family) [Desulfitispora alkaliphila]|uniref:ASKHA domain-containing protein n=1 Tax=Desulfitispora alkaliphila TaxID=622674 RepID=UPI003D1F0461